MVSQEKLAKVTFEFIVTLRRLSLMPTPLMSKDSIDEIFSVWKYVAKWGDNDVY